MNTQSTQPKKKQAAALLIACIIVIAGVVTAIVYTKKQPILTNEQPTTTQKTDSRPTGATSGEATNQNPSSADQTTPGQYIDYTDAALAATPGTKLLFFHAPWCPQCRALDASIKESTIPTGVTIMKVDYDSHQDLRAKYGVTLQTTVVRVDDDGNKVDSYTAYSSPTFKSVEENVL